MTEIYFIRHAQAEGNLYRVLQGTWNGEVTAFGRKQIDALAERFKDIKVDALYSSPLGRAMQTAGAIAKYHDIPIRADARLCEVKQGPWEMRFLGDVIHEYPEQARIFRSDFENWRVEGAENCEEVKARAMSAVTEIAERETGKTAVIVSHGVTLRCILSVITGKALGGEDAVPIFGNTGVAHVIYENGVFRADYINDVSHLDALGGSKWKWDANLRAEVFDPCRDREYYMDCYKDAWIFAHGSTEGYTGAPYFNCAVKHFEKDRESVIRLYDGETPAGLVDLDPERGAQDGFGWISLIYLHPEYRFRNFGVQALGRAVIYFKKQGRHAVRLHVAADNTAAVSFYKKWGFAELERTDTRLGGLILMEYRFGGADDAV